MDGNRHYRLFVSDILKYWSPFSVWEDIEPVMPAEVLAAVARDETDPTPYETVLQGSFCPCEAMRSYHIERIAHLVKFPETEPIIIDVGERGPRVSDGNHRLAAAVCRRDALIPATYDGMEIAFFGFFPARFS